MSLFGAVSELCDQQHANVYTTYQVFCETDISTGQDVGHVCTGYVKGATCTIIKHHCIILNSIVKP